MLSSATGSDGIIISHININDKLSFGGHRFLGGSVSGLAGDDIINRADIYSNWDTLDNLVFEELRSVEAEVSLANFALVYVGNYHVLNFSPVEVHSVFGLKIFLHSALF